MSVAKIDSVDVFPLALPMIRSFRFASGSAGEAGGTAPHVIVRVRDSEGCVGWGEGRPVPQWSYETLESVTTTLRQYLAPAVCGFEARDHIGINRAMHNAIGRGPSAGMPVAKAALDIALHDLNARRAGVTLREYLGGSRKRREMELSWTLTAHSEDTLPADWEEGRALGFRHFNFKAAVAPETDLVIAEYVCSNRPEGGFVWADANQGYELADARRAADVFSQAGVDLLEQPLAANQIWQMKALRASTSIPLAVDEASVDPADFFAHAAAGVVDYLVVKVTRSAGLWASAQQIAVAEAAGLGLILSGLTDGLLTKVAACQICLAHGVSGPAALNGSQFVDETAIFPEKQSIEQGAMVRLNDEPGLGIEPNEDGLRQLSAE